MSDLKLTTELTLECATLHNATITALKDEGDDFVALFAEEGDNQIIVYLDSEQVTKLRRHLFALNHGLKSLVYE